MSILQMLLALVLLCHLTCTQHQHEPPSYKYSREANIKSSATGRSHADPQKLWLEVVGAVVTISALPLILLFLVPDLNKRRGLLKVLLGFAAGGLLGDAFLHIIPHALISTSSDEKTFTSHGHSHAGADSSHTMHDHRKQLFVGMWIIAGIVTFLCIEKLVHLFQHSGHTHSNTAPPMQNEQKQAQNKSKQKKNNGDVAVKDKKQTKQNKEVKAARYLNLAADFTHNFTDGLAIGASFLISQNVGLVTTFTVLIHELPHEIGDFAILVQSGCSSRKAMALQLVTAVGALLGASLSLITAGVGMDWLVSANTLKFLSPALIQTSILPFTAGGFIYIAMTSVMPDLLTGTQSDGSSKLSRFMQSFYELMAMVVGISMMAAISLFE